MNFKRMRRLLLELAIQGKLVPQHASSIIKDFPVRENPETSPFIIPKQWVWLSAKDAFELLSGRDLTKSEILDAVPEGKAYPYITGASQIEGSTILINRWTKNCAVKSVRGDLLITCKGTVGKTAFNTIGDMHIARQIMALRANAKVIEPKYLKIFIDVIAEKLGKEAKSMIPGIDRKTLLNKFIPIPPLEEQTRIVAKLEEAFAEIDRAEKAYEELQTLAGVLRGQILQEAIEGKLVPQLAEEGVVEQIGGAPEEVPFEIPESWKWCHMKGITQKIHYGFTASAANAGNAKLLRITDIQDGRVNWDTVPFCDAPEKKLASCKLGESDVVIARTGGTIGKSFLLIDVSDVAVFASYLIRLIPCAEVVNPKYLMVFLNSPEYWKQLKAMSQGTGQPNVNAKSLSTLLLPLPPLDEQARIVAKVEELLKHVDALSAR